MLNHSIFCIFHCNRYIFKVVGRNLEILLFRGLVRAAGEAVLPFLGHDFIGSVPAALCWIAVVPKLFLHGVNKSKFYSGWWPIQDWPKFLGTLGKLWWWHSILYSNQPDVFENTNKHSRKGTVKLVRGLETKPGEETTERRYLITIFKSLQDCLMGDGAELKVRPEPKGSACCCCPSL